MPGIVADTHALVWYLVKPSRLSPAASAALDKAVDAGEAIHVSAISHGESAKCRQRPCPICATESLQPRRCT